MTSNDADMKDLSYWTLKVAVRAMVGEILIRRACAFLCRPLNVPSRGGWS